MQVNQNLNKFIPKVLLLGNENEIPNDLPKFEIVGKIELRQLEPNVIQLLFEGKPLSESKLKSLDFDYLLCTNYEIYRRNNRSWTTLGSILPKGIFLSKEFFQLYTSNVGFVNAKNLQTLYKLLSNKKSQKPRQILDLDAFLYRGGSFDFPYSYLVPPPPRNYFISKLSSKILPKSNRSIEMFMTRFSHHSKKLNCEVMTQFS
ncbi:MAG: hypothetical protein IJ575_06140 [Selenomonadaceae bacterium]|nr:hypothetical protein [Selenomonadaceae bacterium]